MKIRGIESQDLKSVSSLIRQCYPDREKQSIHQSILTACYPTGPHAMAWRREHHIREIRGWVGIVGPCLIGACCITYPDHQPETTWVSWLAVNPEDRRYGYATKLLRHAVERAAIPYQRGSMRRYLQVDCNSERDLKLMRRTGFQATVQTGSAGRGQVFVLDLATHCKRRPYVIVP